MKHKAIQIAMGMAGLISVMGVFADQETSTRPVFDENGTVHAPAFELPPSQLSSKQAQEFMKVRAKMSGELPTIEPDIIKSRKGLEAMLAPQVAGMLHLYPVAIAEEEIGDVPVRVITPKDSAVHSDRILINLHGGAFNTCWESCSILESTPIASEGGYKVVSVNYSMAPESEHPAGVQDVARVYRELLKDYEANSIGIYGCSAGGALTAQAASWLPAHDLPQAGAIGIFGAGGVRFNAGDSAYLAAYIDGTFPSPTDLRENQIDMTRGYFANADMSDPIISPALHPEAMEKFPPTLIITGTRAMDMSPAIVTNSNLIKAGRQSKLIVGGGHGPLLYLHGSTA